jgi:hypothetical protein
MPVASRRPYACRWAASQWQWGEKWKEFVNDPMRRAFRSSWDVSIESGQVWWSLTTATKRVFFGMHRSSPGKYNAPGVHPVGRTRSGGIFHDSHEAAAASVPGARIVPYQYRDSLLSSVGARRNGGRSHPPNECAVLYPCDSPMMANLEVHADGKRDPHSKRP